eukprot:CAMPEP_0116565766 /NCGR_PEP_ID=MMETSP0397-20121206/14075_1 /TAXON_ID=216820 /ORGANISM="Cyclophora tenuis, Strain ECT3854" /LENGTH=212 /DNA_ID=CAMNT_0004092565 /DNA_START=398 /DNA_END=1036 /DNA_ORIENTATION=+
MMPLFESPGKNLEELITQSSASDGQKLDCLKLLKVVIKNLADPVKSKDAKYRQLKVENEKVRAKIVPFPSALAYLKAIGFAEAEDESSAKVLRIEEVNHTLMTASLQEVTNAIEMLTPQSDAPKPKANVSSSVLRTAPPAKLSEKQKARILLEEKAKREKEENRRQRAKNVALLKQDKHVRKHDENWKSGVSAAMAKTGNSISTFRDRHGEN